MTVDARPIDPTWRPTEEDLASWARVLLDYAYNHRERTKCSREDFAAGFVGALVSLRWAYAFERPLSGWPVTRYPLPGVVEATVACGPNGPEPGAFADMLAAFTSAPVELGEDVPAPGPPTGVADAPDRS